MGRNERLHQLFLTLWDVARENPNYNRKLWGELQALINEVEARTAILRTLLSDIFQSVQDDTDDVDDMTDITMGSVGQSPPDGYAVRFMQSELSRGRPPVEDGLSSSSEDDAEDNAYLETRKLPFVKFTPLEQQRRYDAIRRELDSAAAEALEEPESD